MREIIVVFRVAGRSDFNRVRGEMKDILIISPDPETSRMLELAFELEGWRVDQATTVKGAKAMSAMVVLLDMVEGVDEFRKALTAKSFKGAKVVALAPRGMGEGVVELKVPRTDLVVRRPYELTHLVKASGELISK